VDPFFLIILIITGSLLFPISVGFYRFNRLRTDTALLLGLYIFTFIEEVITIYILYGLKGNPYWLQHIYSPVEYIIIVLVFSRWIHNSTIRKALWISLPIYIILVIITDLTFEPLSESNAFMASISCVVHVFISLYVIISMYSEDHTLELSDYRFWFCSGILLYSMGSVLYFAFYHFLVSYQMWVFHNICNVIAHLFYAMGFLCLQRR
jgi:hypothetical protein